MSTNTVARPAFGRTTSYRLAVVAGLGTAVLLVLVVGAVGVMAEEGYRGDLAYAGVLAAVAGGVVVSRLRAGELAHTMLSSAAAMVAVGILAIVGGVQERPATSVPELLGLHVLFAAGFTASGLLFRHAARTAAPGPERSGR
jgi:hypothetical protein